MAEVRRERWFWLAMCLFVAGGALTNVLGGWLNPAPVATNPHEAGCISATDC